MSERKYQERIGRHLITPQQLLERLPKGIARVVQRRGIPTDGTGRYSIKNEYRRVAREKSIAS